jgi:hypothetical protein
LDAIRNPKNRASFEGKRAAGLGALHFDRGIFRLRCSQAGRGQTAAATSAAVRHTAGKGGIRETLNGRPRNSRESAFHIAST